MTQDSNYCSPDARSQAQPLFIYTVTPLQVYTGTGTSNPVSLFISVFNPKTNGFVAVREILFAISIGTGQNDLTEDPADVEPQSNQSTWDIEKQPYVSSPLIFKVTPNSGTTGLDPNTSISFQLTGINVNDAEGGAAFSIAEVTSGQTRQQEETINKVSPSLAIEYFQANPSSIEPGGQATLSWETGGASYCTIDQLSNSICQGSPPPDPLPTTGELQVCPPLTTIYTLTAYDAGGGHVQAQAGVSVTGAQIIYFASNPTTIDCFNTPSQLEWQVLNAMSLQLDPGVIDVLGQDSYPVTPEVDTTYTLTARGATCQPTTSEATVYVEPASITSFTPSPSTIVRGQTFSLAWETEHANSCSIDQGIGTVTPAPGGSVQTALQEATTYTLSAQGLGPQTTEQTTLTPEPAGWNPQPAPPANSYLPNLVVFQDKLWCIDLYNQWVFWSVDGATWTPVSITNSWSPTALPSPVTVFNNKIWIISSFDHTELPVWYSEDGANWVPATQTVQAPFPRAQTGNIVFKDQLWVIGGYHSGNYFNDVWSTTDGVNWTQAVAQAPWSPRCLISVAIFNDELWMCGGVDANGNTLAETWHTNDGVTWVQAAAPWPERSASGLEAINGQLYLISGMGNNSAVNDMWVMDADLNWSQSPGGTPFANWVVGCVAAFNWRLWLAATDPSQAEIWAYNP